jgi:hypothetical protein
MSGNGAPRFAVVHRLARRVRVVSPLLAKNPERC